MESFISAQRTVKQFRPFTFDGIYENNKILYKVKKVSIRRTSETGFKDRWDQSPLGAQKSNNPGRFKQVGNILRRRGE